MIMSRAIGKSTYSPMTNEIVELLKDHEMVCIWVEDSPRAVVGREFGKDMIEKVVRNCVGRNEVAWLDGS